MCAKLSSFNPPFESDRLPFYPSLLFCLRPPGLEPVMMPRNAEHKNILGEKKNENEMRGGNSWGGKKNSFVFPVW